MDDQVSSMVKEVKDFSKTLDLDHFDKAKNLAQIFNEAKVEFKLPKVDTVEQYLNPD